MNQVGFNIRDMLNKGFLDIRGPSSSLGWEERRSLNKAKVFFYLIRVIVLGAGEARAEL